VAGAAAGLVAAAAFAGSVPTELVLTTLAAAAVGTALSVLASLGPATLQQRPSSLAPLTADS
jgi:hypothetical protein